MSAPPTMNIDWKEEISVMWIILWSKWQLLVSLWLCYYHYYYCYYNYFHYYNYCFIFRYSNEMAEKSCIIGLPVVPYNQNKISDVCQYLQWLQDLLYKVFKNEVTFTVRIQGTFVNFSIRTIFCLSVSCFLSRFKYQQCTFCL